MGPQAIQLSDFVGEHGPYQLAITAFLFISLPMEEVLAIMPNISTLNEREQELEMKEEFKRICQLDLHLYQQAYLNYTSMQQANQSKGAKQPSTRPKFNASSTRIRECTDFTYELAQDQGRTMTSEFDLVCDRDWLRSFFQSILSAAIVVAHVFWGTFSDRYGRFKAQKLCMLVSLFAGGLSTVAVDFWTFAITRALCSFGDLGLVVSLTTNLVELVGNQYRGISVAVVNFGYALGVTILPYIVAYFEDFRLVIAFTLFCHIITMPFILATNESVRWLLTNRKFKLARKELKRVARWNEQSKKLWPRNESERKDDQEAQQQRLEEGQISPIEVNERRKLAFELLFNKFVNQIESQNLCDPISSEEQQESPESSPKLPTSVAHIRTMRAGGSYLVVREASRLSASACQLDGQQPIDTSAKALQRTESCGGLECGSSKPSSVEVDSFCQEDILVRRRHHHQQSQCQPDCINLVAHQLSFVGRVMRLFKDKELMIVVFTLVWTTFNSELQYTSFIIINLEVGEDLYLNYILGGCMEALAAITASLLLSYASRRLSLIAFWLLISVSCFGLSVAHIDSTWAVWLLALAKFSQSSLSSISSVAAYESFPTFLRQSGSGLVFTLGMLGSVFAPIIFAEFDDHQGMDNVLMTFSLSSLTAAILIYLYLKETRNCELQ